MLGIKTKAIDAERTKDLLLKNNLFDKMHYANSAGSHVYFPLIRKPDFKIPGALYVNCRFKSSKKKQTIKGMLEKKFSSKESEFIRRGFDTIGDIAILDIPKQLAKKQRMIAQAVFSLNKGIKTVLKKKGIHFGKFRTQKLEFLAGENRKETIYKENGILLKLNVEKVYFSPRLSTERKRIAELVLPGEEVLVMFCGCAPYPLMIARNSPAHHITGIELNPVAYRYAVENVKLNKIANITLIKGDVKKIAPKLGKTFDRILMPLPKGAEDFLKNAFQVSKKGTIIHFYDFLDECDIPDKAIKKLNSEASLCKKKIKILNYARCGEYAPHVYRICVDVLVTTK